jgi:carotenoid cleavage dioxygenase-like enzyme
VRTLKAPGFIFGHILNTFEDGEDIVIDLTWYSAGNATTLGWMNRWFLSYMMSEPVREAWPRAQVVRYRLKANDEVEEARLFADENGANDFEAPKINEEFQGLKYCISYFMQFHTYEYDKDPTSVQSGPFGAVGIAKRNLCTGERSGWYEPNTYPSEVQFVANPSGSAEDDGILLSMVFDCNRNASYFQILDARTLRRIATASLPIKTPFLIHSSWCPEQAVLV